MEDREQRANRFGRTRGCAVCDPEATGTKPICSACGDPREVRAFCTRCETRTHYTPAQASRLYCAFGMTRDQLAAIVTPGLVIRMNGCPLCPGHREGDLIHHTLFHIDRPEAVAGHPA